ncbi:MAG: aspartyl protease family protein [Chthoniobacterales bacterium]|nr:aspartyl protease family protein [Chthoniobacterales bacterium]
MKISGAGMVTRHLLAELSALLLSLPSLAAPLPNDAGSQQYQALPLERSRQNHLLVRARINGKAALLGVDTGAPVSAIALSRRKHFGLTALPGSSELPARLRINGGFNRVAIAHRLELGALMLLDEPMVTIDLSGPANASHDFHEEQLDGILGADIMFPTNAVLDCEKQLLIMKLDPDTPGTVPGVNHRGWRDIPIRVTKGWNLFVDGKLNGKAAQLMLDTGAFTTLIHRPFVRQMRLPLRDTPYTSGAVNLDDRDLQLATIGRFSVGSFEVKRKEVGVMDLAGLIHGDLLKGTPPVVGLLGSEFLRRNHGIIDFGTRTLYLKL